VKDKYYINLSSEERTNVINSLILLKNRLISNGKYTDGVDDVLIKIMNAKTKKFTVKS
jgi:hypothetical protein